MSDAPVASPADTNLADIRARFSASWSEASQAVAEAADGTEPQFEQLAMPCPPGYVVWGIKGSSGRTMLPLLLASAPPRIVHGYFARIQSNLVGTCPVCRQTAWISANAPDPERNRAGWAHLDITFGVDHLPACSAVMHESDRRYFDARAVGPAPR